jgi:hypothetical protein
MSTTKRSTRKRIATRKAADGYRVTGHRKTYHSFAGAFQAAWRMCAETGADLYAVTPEGKWVTLLTAEMIRDYERTGASA